MIKEKVPAKVVAEILQRIASDEDFRRQLRGSNAAAALARYGVDVDSSKLPSNPSLPDHQQILAVRDSLRENAERELGLSILLLK